MYTINWDHLTDKKDLIKTWIYTPEEFLSWDVKVNIRKMLDNNWEIIDYFWSLDEKEKLNILHDWERTYSISDCNSSSKHSYWYADCTWIIAVWRDIETWENISLLTHQDPEYLFYRWNTNNFSKDLSTRLKSLVSRSINWTLDIVVYWWYFRYDELNEAYIKYIKSLKLLNSIILKETNITPVIINWPNLHLHIWATDVYLDTKRRVIHLIRPFQRINITNRPILLDDIQKMDYFICDFD